MPKVTELVMGELEFKVNRQLILASLWDGKKAALYAGRWGGRNNVRAEVIRCLI